jgi:hypothetical protein
MAIRTLKECHNHVASPMSDDLSDAPARPRGRTAPAGAADRIRARKDTQLRIEGGTSILRCTGTDSGIAVDRIEGVESAGPYTIAFRLQAAAGDNGELFFTTDAQTKLPGGERITFPITQDDTWRDVQLRLNTSERMFAFRLDPGDSPGEVRIQDLRLLDADGGVLRQWPQPDRGIGFQPDK